MTTALLVQPSFDDPTRIQAQFFLKILDGLIKLGKVKGIKTIVLYGPKANEDEFKLAIAKYNPEFIYFGGHGTETQIIGEDSDTLIQLGYNEWLLKDRLIYAFECKSAYILPKIAGTKVFLGYKGPFYIYANEKYTPMYMNLGFRPLLMIYEGYTFGQAYKSTKKLYEYYLSKDLPDIVRRTLYANYKNFVLIGDGNTKLI